MRRTVPAHELIALAEKCARAAGQLLLERSVSGRDVQLKPGTTDVVTDADLAAEAAIRAAIRDHRPHDAVVGEEKGEQPGSTSIRWVVDALDGTVNYIAGGSEWAVSIAVEDMTEGFVAGVVHAPRVGRTYSACRGAGAWCNGFRLPTLDSAGARLEECVVATGFAADPARRVVQAAQLTRVLPHVRDVRCRGAASLELCAVAAGEAAAYYESDLRLWDIAAGRLIASEAGAEITGDAPLGGHPLIAGPRPTRSALAELLSS
jgi:myo-inositol-1(or 4)-monophosphatase